MNEIIEKKLMLSLVASDNMLEVIHHLSVYGSSMGLTALIGGRYSSFNKMWHEITPWSHPLMKASGNEITKTSTVLEKWSSVSNLSCDLIAKKIRSQDGGSKKRIVIQNYNEQMEGKEKSSVMIAICLDDKKGVQFGLLAFIAPISSLMFLKTSSSTEATTMSMTAVPTTFEQTFVQLAEASLLRTTQHAVLRQNSQLLTRIGNMNGLTTGIIAVDLDGVVVHYNKTLENMVGWTSDDVQSKGWTKLVYPDPNVRSQMEKGIATLLLNSTGHTVDRRLTRKNGTTGVYIITSFSIHRNDGGPPILAGTFICKDGNSSNHKMIATPSDKEGMKNSVPVNDGNENENKKQSGTTTTSSTSSTSSSSIINENDQQVHSSTTAHGSNNSSNGANAANKERDLNISRLGSLAAAIGKTRITPASADTTTTTGCFCWQLQTLDSTS